MYPQGLTHRPSSRSILPVPSGWRQDARHSEANSSGHPGSGLTVSRGRLDGNLTRGMAIDPGGHVWILNDEAAAISELDWMEAQFLLLQVIRLVCSYLSLSPSTNPQTSGSRILRSKSRLTENC